MTELEVAALVRERDSLREKLERERREHDECRARLHEVTEQRDRMAACASGSATTVVAALDRIEPMDAVVRAARALVAVADSVGHVARMSEFGQLAAALGRLDDVIKRRPSA